MIRVEVAEGHIRHGKVKKCNECPVALAGSEAIGGGPFAVEYRTFRGVYCIVTPRGEVLAPRSVADFVDRFDRRATHKDGTIFIDVFHGPMPKPFTFELPDFDSGEWRKKCVGCGEMFSPPDDLANTCDDCLGEESEGE